MTIEHITEVNLISFMDLAYSLLIVFMLTTPLAYKQLQIQVPDVQKKRESEAQSKVYNTVSLDAQGRYFVNQIPVYWKELEAYCFTWSKADPMPIIEVEADAALAYQKVAEIIDLLKYYRLKSVSLKVR